MRTVLAGHGLVALGTLNTAAVLPPWPVDNVDIFDEWRNVFLKFASGRSAGMKESVWRYIPISFLLI